MDLYFNFNKIERSFPSSSLGIQVREALASIIREARASETAFPSWSLGTSVIPVCTGISKHPINDFCRADLRSKKHVFYSADEFFQHLYA